MRETAWGRHWTVLRSMAMALGRFEMDAVGHIETALETALRHIEMDAMGHIETTLRHIETQKVLRQIKTTSQQRQRRARHVETH